MSISYPLDLTGTSSVNKITNETVLLTTNTRNRAFALKNAPYFLNSLELVDNATGIALTKSQWKPFFLVQSATYKATSSNDSIYAICIITDSTVSNSLNASYQTVGSDYIGDYANVVSLVNTAVGDSRSVNWDNILTKVMNYNAAIKAQSIDNLTNADLMLIAIEKLAQIVLLGDTISQESLYLYIDTLTATFNGIYNNLAITGTPLGDHINNKSAHNYTADDFGLGNVQNYGVASDADAVAGTITNAYVLLSTAKALIQNALSGGINAHILDKNNPHGLTAAHFGLSKIKNYGVATLDDLNNPNSDNPLYVTTNVLGTWLTNYINDQAAKYTSDKNTIKSALDQAAEDSLAALNQSNAALNKVLSFTANLNKLSNSVNLIKTEITALSNLSNNQATLAANLISKYLTPAITKARESGYTEGFTNGTNTGIVIAGTITGTIPGGTTPIVVPTLTYSQLITYFTSFITQWFKLLPTTPPSGPGVFYNNAGTLAITPGVMSLTSSDIVQLTSTTFNSLLYYYNAVTNGSSSSMTLSTINIIFTNFFSTWANSLSTTISTNAGTFYNNGGEIVMTTGSTSLSNSDVVILASQTLNGIITNFNGVLNAWMNTLPSNLPSSTNVIWNDGGIIALSI